MKTCILLSTAGSLLNYKHGTYIDSHDIVIRTGQGPIKGYEDYVGTKTNYRIMSVALFDEWRNMNIPQLLNDLTDEILVYTKEKNCRKINNYHEHFKISNEFFCTYEYKCDLLSDWKRDVSSGFQSIFTSFYQLGCTNLKMLGFNTTENLRASYHYWKDGSVHDNINSNTWYNKRRRNKWAHNFYIEQKFIEYVSMNSTICKKTIDAICNYNTLKYRFHSDL